MSPGAKAASPRPERVELRVARIVKAHGLKGGVKLELYTDDPELRFRPGASFSLQVPEGSEWFGRQITLSSVREVNTQPVAFFEGVEDRSRAESLVRAILWVEHDPEIVSAEKDAWFDHQLVGLTVRRDGAEVGRVSRVDHLPAQDLLVIATDSGEVLLPFVAAFVPEVDIDAGYIVITPPGGLFEDVEELG